MKYWYPALQFILRRPYGIHSPFLYAFAEQCLYASNDQHEFSQLENIRRDLENDHSTITRQDFGAGSRPGFLTKWFEPGSKISKSRPSGEKQEQVCTIAKRSLQRPKYGRLFCRMTRYLDAKNILELGTSFGISAAYFALGNPNASIQTIEACRQSATIAQTVFNKAGLHNIKLHTGRFDKVFPTILNENVRFDMVYIDGDHSYQGIIENYSLIRKHMAPDGVIIIDDIRWSIQMWRAWKEIISNERVSISLDLWRLGIVFFSKKLNKQNIIIGY